MDDINIIFPILYVYGTINAKYCDDIRKNGFFGIQNGVFENVKITLNKF